MNFGLTEKHLNSITDALKLHPEIEAAKIFGSRALQTHRPGSDIDIALYGEAVTLTTLLKLAPKNQAVAQAPALKGTPQSLINQRLIKLFRIKRTTHPLHIAFILLMLRLLQHLQHIHITPGPATIFRRTTHPARNTNRILQLVIKRQNLLQNNRMLPIITEIVIILQLILFLFQKSIQFKTSIVLHPKIIQIILHW